MKLGRWMLFLILVLICVPAYGAEFYVKNTGSDSADGMSDATAWKTVGKVNSANLNSGDVVYFKRGNVWTDARLEPQSSVVYDAYGLDDRPHIDRRGNTGTQSIAVFTTTSGASIKNLKLTSGSAAYAVVDGSGGSVALLDGCEIIHSYSGPNYLVGAEAVGEWRCPIVRNCIISVPYGAGIYSHGLSNVIFSGNIIECAQLPIKIGDSGFQSNCLVENNYIVLTGVSGQSPYVWGLTAKSVHDYVIRNNVIDITNAASDQEGAIYCINGHDGNYNGEIYNNVIISNGDHEGIYIKFVSGGGFKIKNNILYDCSTGVYMGNSVPANGATVDNNAFYSCNTNIYAEAAGIHTENGNMTTDPKFVDSRNSPAPYYALSSDSLCIDAGINDDPDIPDQDYNGVSRPQGIAIDIGASEYQPGGANQPPNASFNANPSSGEPPLSVQFTDTSADPDGTIVSWNWDFGDGGTSTAQNPSHTYNNAGTYTVTLTVTDDDDATDSASTTISVSSPGNQPPNASFNANPSSGEPPLSVQFTDTSTDPDGTIVSWNWEFGDGDTSTAQNPSHTFNNVGTYTSTLTVTDDDDATDRASTTISVSSRETVSISIEAESGTLNLASLLVIGDDPNPTASRGEYVYSPAGSGDTTNPTAQALYNIDIPYAGDYYLWLSMYGPTGNNDAMYIGFNGNFDRVYTTQWEKYEWVRVETTDGSENFAHLMSAGTNQINIGHGEELARVDMIFVTDDPDFVPSGIPPAEVPSAPTGLGVSVSE